MHSRALLLLSPGARNVDGDSRDLIEMLQQRGLETPAHFRVRPDALTVFVPSE